MHGQVRPERGGRPARVRGSGLPGHKALDVEVCLAGEHLVVGRLPAFRQPARIRLSGSFTVS